MTRDFRRRMLSHVIITLCGAAVLVALVPLALVLFYVVSQGVTSLSFSFFTEMPKPVGEVGGGMANAIIGSLIVTSLGALMAIPIGIMSGIYAAEYAGTQLASAIRFAADTLNGVPSIVIGVFVYSLAVLPLGRFSALAGGLALGIMMIPLIMRTTEELLRLVPTTLREGALALGATRARAVFTVVVPAALPGILTGILLALARIAGETAPLLFTALNSQFWSTDVGQPIATLTVQVFAYAISPVRRLASSGVGRRAGPGRAGAAVLAAGPGGDGPDGKTAARRLTAQDPPPAAAIPSRRIRSSTRDRISSRMRRTTPAGFAFGSSSGQSSIRIPGTYGHASPQPIVTSTLVPAASSVVSFCGFAALRSMPTSRIIATTSG